MTIPRRHLNMTGMFFSGTAYVDPSGEERVAWHYVATVPCRVRLATQYAMLRVGVMSTVTHKIHVDYHDWLYESPKQRWRIDVQEGTGPLTRRSYVLVEAWDPGRKMHHLELAVRRLDEEEVIQLIMPDEIPSTAAIGGHALA